MPVETVSNYNEDALKVLVARIEGEGGTIRQVLSHGDRWTVLYDAGKTSKVETRAVKAESDPAWINNVTGSTPPKRRK